MLEYTILPFALESIAFLYMLCYADGNPRQEVNRLSNPTGPVQSIDRALNIVEALATVPQGMALSDLAAATDLHISTACRLLSALSNRGYVRKDPESGKYRLTLRLFEIGSRVSGTMDLLTVAKPRLDALSNFTQEAVHLAKRDGAEMVYLYKAEPFQQLVRMSSHVGRRNPMYCTGVGKCILALLPPDEIKKIWDASDVHKFTDKTITDFSEFQRDLEEVHRRGYGVDDEENELGVRCIAVAIKDWEGKPFAAVSVSAPTFRMNQASIAKYLPKMKELSDEVSHLLGKV